MSRGGRDAAIARGVAMASYADMVRCETAEPDRDEARAFAEGIQRHRPGRLLAYKRSPSFNWRRKLGATELERFQVVL